MRAAAGRGVNPLRSLSPAFLYQSSRLLYKPSRLLYPFRVPQRLANGCLTNPRGCYPFRVHARLSSQLLYRIYWGGVPRRACAPRPAGGLTPCGRSVKPVTLRWLGPRRGGLARGRAFPRPLPEQLGDEVCNYAQPPAPAPSPKGTLLRPPQGAPSPSPAAPQPKRNFTRGMSSGSS